MLYGLYLSAAGLQVQERKQDIITNNLANSPTTGFKRDLAIVQSRANAVLEDASMSQYRVPVLDNQGGGVTLQSAGVDLSQALFQHTGNATDMALDGRGFFVLQSDASSKRPILTRDGGFLINNEGTLVQATSGRAVLADDGQPVKLNPALPVTVDPTGKISQGEGAAVQLKLLDVTDSRRLIKLGKNALTVNDEKDLTAASPSTVVRQNNLELSGVDPVVEFVNMMTGQRVFDANAKMISMQDTTLQELNGVGRIA